MCARVAEKFEAVSLWAGEGVLMAENNACGIFFKTAGADKSAASAAFRSAGNRKFLRVGVEGRRGVLDDCVFRFPVFEGGGGARINVVAGAVAGIFASFFDGDKILR